MKINYITPANVEEMIEFVNFNTANDIAEFEAQIEAVHTAAIGDREIDVCIVSSKDPDVKIPFPPCIVTGKQIGRASCRERVSSPV